jgi:tRNA A22 N-methylase
MTALRTIAPHSCSSFAAWNVTPSTLEQAKQGVVPPTDRHRIMALCCDGVAIIRVA